MRRKNTPPSLQGIPGSSADTTPPIRVLVVEGEVVTLEAITSHLGHLGYQVAGQVTSGQEALTLIPQLKPDLALVDIVLGSDPLGGIKLAREIRYQFGLPIVFLTTHSDQSTLDQIRCVSAFGYVTKPFQEMHLRIAIETTLGTHRLERLIFQQQQLVSLILNSTQDGIIASDLDGVILFLNAAAEHLTGCPRHETLGRSLDEVVRFIDRRTGLPLGTLLRAQEQHPYSLGDAISLQSPDQSSRPVAGYVIPLMDREARSLGQLLLLSDQGEQQRIKVLESELESCRRSEQELQQLLAQEKQYNQRQTRMTAMLSHEFRTPLTTFSVAMELLRMRGAQIDDVQRETYLKQMKAAGNCMNQLIESVVAFSKIESGHFRFSPLLFDLQEFCQELSREHQLLAGDRYCIRFNYQGIRQVTLDRDLFSHAMNNILTNAIKYSPRGGMISFSIQADSDQIICRVRDQGMGIPKADLEHLFQLFYRGSNVGSIAGTGMGLAIVQRCVALHQGRISLESELGVGTEFTITLPQGEGSNSTFPQDPRRIPVK